MPKGPTLKTYSRKNNYNSKFIQTVQKSQINFPVSAASSAFDALFAKNLKIRDSYSRNRSKDDKSVEIIQTSSNSLHVKINSTFDKLLNGTKYNVVNLRNISSFFQQSEHSSVIKKHVSPAVNKHVSPYNTRKNKKNVGKPKDDTSKKKGKATRGTKHSNKKSTKKQSKATKTKAKVTKPESLSASSAAASGKELNSYDKPITHELVVEKVVNKRRTASLELSRALRSASKKYLQENGTNLCARKFTPIASTSRVLAKNLIRVMHGENSIFQNGFQQRMCAESTPKYITSGTPRHLPSSTPIPSEKRNNVDVKIDVSPIRTRNKTKLTFESCSASLITSTNNSKALAAKMSQCNSDASLKVLSSSLTTSNSLRLSLSNVYKLRDRSMIEWRNLKDMTQTRKSKIRNDKRLNAVPLVVVTNIVPNISAKDVEARGGGSQKRKITIDNCGRANKRPKADSVVDISATSSVHQLVDASIITIDSSSGGGGVEEKREHVATRKAKKAKSGSFSTSLEAWEKFSQSNLSLLLRNDQSGPYSISVYLENANCDKEKSVAGKNETDCVPAANPTRNKVIKFCELVPRVTLFDCNRQPADRKSLHLRRGKHWFRSLSILRSSIASQPASHSHKGRKWRETVCALYENQKNQSTFNNCSNAPDRYNFQVHKLHTVQRRPSVRIVEESLNECSPVHKSGYFSTVADESILGSFEKLSLTADAGNREEAARQIILKRCGQVAPVPFGQCFSSSTLQKCRKIGEGVYGEVFMYKAADGHCKVIKIIPIEGSQVVNGERQKKFEEIFSEIVITSELSGLRESKEFSTDGFVELLGVHCVQGKYPKELIELWELYDEDHGSENDSPELFTDEQLYVVLELANAGQDLESYQFDSAEQTYALFVQLVCALAVAESALKFEHRDMHWGNVLIASTAEPTSLVRVNGRSLDISNKGVKLSIIDFTLSRMTFDNCCVYNDLALDPDLFTAIGDYQFDIYRHMQKRNGNDWQKFEPYSNVLWLDYTLEKMTKEARYLRPNTRTHKSFLRRLSHLRKDILAYNSATELLHSDVFAHMFL